MMRADAERKAVFITIRMRQSKHGTREQKGEKMEGYKAFEAGWECRGFQYKIGETYELPAGQKLEICKCGFHFCQNPIDVFGYYPMRDDILIAKVEALGNIQQEGTKFVTDKIKIVREFTRKELHALILDGNYNSGNRNSGDCNSGNYNSGNYNSGYYNSGGYNSGYYNSGDCNSGNYNSGDCNSGDRNSGNYNSGDYNSGYYNDGNYNSGIFNTNEPCMRAFNKESTIKFPDFIKNLDYDFFELCRRIDRKVLIAGDVDKIKALPNFDAGIFEEITGIEIK